MTSESDPPSGEQARKADRYPVQIDATIRRQGANRFGVAVHDLSTHGFKVAAHAGLPVGTMVWLTVPGLESLSARVAWSDYEWAGCEFERPLHPAVLDRMVQPR